MEIVDYKYAAFVSYSSKDAVAARRIHRSLESYRLPPSLRSSLRGGNGRTLFPVFRDREELASGNLSELLKSALDNSASLIVVASPNSANSEWVNQEVLHFINSGRSADISAIIIDGEPNSSNEELECLPIMMRNQEQSVVAGDARRTHDGYGRAIQKVVAGLLKVPLDELIKRERRFGIVRALISSPVLVFFLSLFILMASITAGHKEVLINGLSNADGHFRIENSSVNLNALNDFPGMSHAIEVTEFHAVAKSIRSSAAMELRGLGFPQDGRRKSLLYDSIYEKLSSNNPLGIDNVVLGAFLSNQLGVFEGDLIWIATYGDPQAVQKPFYVAGMIEFGVVEMDQTIALTNLDVANEMSGLESAALQIGWVEDFGVRGDVIAEYTRGLESYDTITTFDQKFSTYLGAINIEFWTMMSVYSFVLWALGLIIATQLGLVSLGISVVVGALSGLAMSAGVDYVLDVVEWMFGRELFPPTVYGTYGVPALVSPEIALQLASPALLAGTLVWFIKFARTERAVGILRLRNKA